MSLAKRQCRILMPHHKPVGRWRFIEKRCVKRKCACAEGLHRDAHEPRILSESRDGWKFHGMAYTGSAARQVHAAKFIKQSMRFLWFEDVRNNRVTLFLNRVQPTQ